MKVGILAPVCSRNQSWTSYDECYLAQALLPSFERTKSRNVEYCFYIGIDSDDTFFLSHQDRMPGTKVIVENCHHAPAHVWNHLFKRAYDDGCEYMFQIADDVVIETPGWTEKFIVKLQENVNRGVVGPCHPENWGLRKNAGKPFVLENAFVHRSHYDRFGFLYPWEIRNWYCDDWISRVYEGCLSYMFEDIIVHNLSVRSPNQRYTIEHPNWWACVEQGRKTLREQTKGCFSFCLYGGYTNKYYKGLTQNIDIIRRDFPTWDIVVYAAPDAEAFVRSLSGVQCVATGKPGAVNMTYRFLEIGNPDYDVVCVRDADSRINERDQWCIRHFLDSPARVYTIRDHPLHRYRIMGGLWGAKRGYHLDASVLRKYCHEIQAGYTSDTQFLEKHLRTGNVLVYSYDPTGLFADPTEKIVRIDCPGDFCGNVILFDANGAEYPEFTR